MKNAIPPVPNMSSQAGQPGAMQLLDKVESDDPKHAQHQNGPVPSFQQTPDKIEVITTFSAMYTSTYPKLLPIPRLDTSLLVIRLGRLAVTLTHIFLIFSL